MTSTSWPRLSEEFRAKLVSTPCKDIAPPWSQIVVATSDDTVSKVFVKLIENKLFGLPLYDSASMKYVAFIDMFDILAYVAQELNMPAELSQGNWTTSSIMQSTSCMVLPGRSQRSTWNIIGMDTPIQSAINQLCQSNRLALIDARGTLSSVMSRSRVINFLSNSWNADSSLVKFFSEPIEALRLVRGPVVSLHENENAINAFMMMYQQDVSGVAVLDDDKQLVGNISVSDLKDLGYSMSIFSSLHMPCKRFIARKIEGFEVPNPVYVTKSTPLSMVMEKFQIHKIRRVYVVQSPTNLLPVGVITHTDVLELFAALTAA